MIDGLEEYGSMEVEEYADLLGNSVGEWCLIGMGGVPFIKFIERFFRVTEAISKNKARMAPLRKMVIRTGGR